MTTLAIQLFLIVTWFAEQAFTLALKMTSSMTLLPYLLVAAYGFKLAWSGETYAADGARRATPTSVIGAIATLYAAAMLLAGGAKFLLLSALLYAPGTLAVCAGAARAGAAPVRPARALVLRAAVPGSRGRAGGAGQRRVDHLSNLLQAPQSMPTSTRTLRPCAAAAPGRIAGRTPS